MLGLGVEMGGDRGRETLMAGSPGIRAGLNRDAFCLPFHSFLSMPESGQKACRYAGTGLSWTQH